MPDITEELSEFMKDMVELKKFKELVPVKWKTRSEIYSSLLPKCGRGAELGVLWGVNAKALFDMSKPSMLFLIDKWHSCGIPGDPEKPNKFAARTEMKYKKTCDTFRKNQGVKVWKAYTFEASESVENDSLDWIYVDANHRYGAVLTDLQMWTPKVKVGGYVMCHDFTLSIWNGGVIEAVKYYLRRPGDLKIIGRDDERCSTIVLQRIGVK